MQTALVKYKITQKKWFFSNPNSADQLGQAQKLQKQINSAVPILVLSTLVKYKITKTKWFLVIQTVQITYVKHKKRKIELILHW